MPQPRKSTRIEAPSNSLDSVAYALLVVCCMAHAATVLITWETWQVRSEIPNLPWIPLTPQIPCGIILMLSLLGVLISPRRFGMAIHLGILVSAIAMDQFRCQPQIISITILMAACVWPIAKRFCFWYLIAMWGWAGLHKLLSPDWYGAVAYDLLSRPPIRMPELYFEFAIGVAISEIGLCGLAWFRPKLGVFLCIPFHVGIVIFLIAIQWNYSVIPWNLCTAIVGAWVLWSAAEGHIFGWPKTKMESTLAAIVLILPAAYYFGLVRHCFVHVLYSGNLPQAVITYEDHVMPLAAIDKLAVPFPHAHKTFADYFVLTGMPGEKLHIRDPRSMVNDRYYGLSDQNVLTELSRSEFLSNKNRSVVGVERDDDRAIFQLALAKVNLLKRSKNEMVYAVGFDPERFSPELLIHLAGLPNLEQIQLADCDINDADLIHLVHLPKLEAIGLERTSISDRGLEILRKSPRLNLIEFEGTAISDAAMQSFLKNARNANAIEK